MQKLFAVLTLFSCTTFAADDIKVSGFVDTYYAYESNNIQTFERPYTTQAVRPNEFNINLAFVEALVARPKTRGRLALQAGTSVQNNYSAEPTNGPTSSGTLSRHIQEAVIGYQAHENLWIDGGIYFSHIGMESFISRDNWAYTRSLSAEFSPYYQSGVKGTWQLSTQTSMQLHVINGWQNISETNSDKAVGLQWSHNPNAQWNIAYNNFIGRENRGARVFHNVLAKFSGTEWQVGCNIDVGSQDVRALNEIKNWYAYGLQTRRQLSAGKSLTLRLEKYQDPDLIIVTAPTGSGIALTRFDVLSASLGYDVQLDEETVWRSEVRGYFGRDDVFVDERGTPKDSDGVVVTSLGLTL